MAARNEPGNLIELASLPNLRDIGGYPGHGGRVQTGVLYGATALDKVAGDDRARLGQFGIRTMFDLPTANERSAEPDQLPHGRRLVVCDDLADSHDEAPAQVIKALTDPALAEQMLGGEKAATLFDSAYRTHQTSSRPHRPARGRAVRCGRTRP